MIYRLGTLTPTGVSASQCTPLLSQQSPPLPPVKYELHSTFSQFWHETLITRSIHKLTNVSKVSKLYTWDMYSYHCTTMPSSRPLSWLSACVKTTYWQHQKRTIIFFFRKLLLTLTLTLTLYDTVCLILIIMQWKNDSLH